MRNRKLNGSAEHSNENEHTNKVSVLDVARQNQIQREDEVQAMKTRIFKLEEDIKNILRMFEDSLITTNNKM